ncbi:hypothetical protein HHL19_35640 [Streptomyces sp. R302]|uniref:hypothetical protein n=1 Tax=unclassified Streptomyces TaxID=2593676 RepID=UPI00145E1E6B|nr:MULTISPECIES: hypothetical protein [unclassified Streptomyces]NML55127.1 hypothetical protein [Streptomyces sp. R301]NML83843.1 hypothetical protein [Streptomyces sp. R302]
MAEWTPIGGTLVSSAKGRSWREEAACWLLAESGSGESHWPDRLQEAGLLSWETQESEDWDLVFVRWSALAQTLARKDHDPADGLYGTGAEWCVLRFACSLMTGKGGNWGTDLPRLDGSNQRIVLGALAWAAGGEAAAHPYMLPKRPEPEPVPPTPLHIVD